jgi:putative spermidine/putrescine transport system permease protein
VKAVFHGTVGLALAWLLLPLAVIVFASLTADSTPTFPPSGFTAKWFLAAWDVSSFRSGLQTSLLVATLATALACPLGVTAAIGLVRSRTRFRSVLEAVLLAPIFVPGLVTGIGLLLALSQLDADLGVSRLIAGHLLVTFPYIVRTTYASLAGQNEDLEDAARTLGAGELQVIWRVVLPLARPGILAGALFAFIMSFDEVPLSLLLAEARSPTLPLAVLAYLEFNFDPAVSAVSAAQILVTFFIAIVLERSFGLQRLYGAANG